MKLTRSTTVVLDAADLETSSRFWSEFLGGTVDRSDDWHSIRLEGDLTLAIQLAPGHERPQWPAGRPQQVHLDFHPEDVSAALAEAVELGAEHLHTEREGQDTGFHVLADPAGHPFCLCW